MQAAAPAGTAYAPSGVLQLASSARASARSPQARKRALVGDRLHRRTHALVVGASLQRERALPGRRHEALQLELPPVSDSRPEPIQPGAREHDRVEDFVRVRQLTQARFDVAADGTTSRSSRRGS